MLRLTLIIESEATLHFEVTLVLYNDHLNDFLATDQPEYKTVFALKSIFADVIMVNSKPVTQLQFEIARHNNIIIIESTK